MEELRAAVAKAEGIDAPAVADAVSAATRALAALDEEVASLAALASALSGDDDAASGARAATRMVPSIYSARSSGRIAVFRADRGDAAGRDVDSPRATERAKRTKIDGC